jgi:threonyl-tRNA synthetase
VITINLSELTQVRNSAAFVLAAAISQVFPKARFLTGGSTSFGFYYDFILEDVKEEQFGFIEETMANLIAKNEIKTLYMTTQNAKEFFRHYGFLDKAKEITELGFVNLLQINNFIDFQNGSCQDTRDLLFFKLFQIEKIDGITRIFGALFDDSKGLKNFLKEQKKYPLVNHSLIAEEMGLFYSFNEGIWSFKGKDLKDLLLNFLTKELKKENFFFIETQNVVKSLSFLLRKEKKFLKLPLRIAEIKQTERPVEDFLNPPSGFFSLNNVYTLSEYILCEKTFVLEEVISSLNF